MPIENFVSAIQSKDRIIEELQSQLDAKNQEIEQLKSRQRLEARRHSCRNEKLLADQAEAALSLAEWRMQQALLAGHSFTFDWDPTTDQVERSESCAAILGLAGEAALRSTGQDFFQRIHPDDRDRFMHILHALTPETANYSTELRVRRGDGTVIVLEETGKAQFDADGRPVRVFGVATDISTRKQAEELARQRLEELEDLYRNAPVGLCVLDTDLRFVRINERLAEINGIPQAEHIGKTVRELLPAFADVTELAMRQVLSTGVPKLDIEIVSETPAQPGVQRSWTEQWLPTKDARGRVTGLSIVAAETTRHKQDEAELRRSEARYRLLHESLRDGFVQVTMEGQIIDCNEVYSRMLGYSTDELRLLTYLQITPERWHDIEATIVRDQILPRGYSDIYEKEYRRKDGTVFPVEFRTILIRDDDGQPAAMWAIVRDITERKKNEEEMKALNDELERRVELRTRELQETQSHLLHAEKLSAIGRLSASIAHEFNNPLQSVLTILKGLKNRLTLEEQDRVFLDLAFSESERMKNLIRSLQDFNRPSSSRKVLMDVHATIDSLMLLSKIDLKRKGISTVLNFDKGLPQIFAIPDQIKQVILNLLQNAADACHGNNGQITIRTYREDEKIAIAIQDNGIGIPHDKTTQIFQPFYTTKQEVKGTGLGLSICHGIVQNHQGEIRVESEPGKGSTFTILLPISEESVDKAALDQAGAAGGIPPGATMGPGRKYT